MSVSISRRRDEKPSPRDYYLCQSFGGGEGSESAIGPAEWGFNWTELLRMHVLSVEQDSWIFEPDEGF